MNNEDNMNPGTNQAPPPNNSYVAFPPEIKKWNWGAFTFNIWWGIGHKTYLPLLCLVPLLNIVWVFICGIKGNEWLWQTGEFSSPAELLKSQVAWNRAGFISFIVAVVFFIIYIIIFVVVLGSAFSFFNSLDSYSTF